MNAKATNLSDLVVFSLEYPIFPDTTSILIILKLELLCSNYYFNVGTINYARFKIDWQSWSRVISCRTMRAMNLTNLRNP